MTLLLLFNNLIFRQAVAYPPLFQQPYITYVIPSLPAHAPATATTTVAATTAATTTNPSLYHPSSINNLIAYY